MAIHLLISEEQVWFASSGWQYEWQLNNRVDRPREGGQDWGETWAIEEK